VIVEEGVGAYGDVPTKIVHHRNFPEVTARCGSVAEGVAELVSQFSRARESVGGKWHREAIEEAMADVAAFVETLEEASRQGVESCSCDVPVSGRAETPALGRDSSR
jgi:hypothetical protein